MQAYLPGFYRLLSQHRFTFPLQEAVIYNDLRLYFDELYGRVNRLADALAGMGVGEAGRVLWLGLNSHAMIELLFACSRLGASVCYANWRQSAAELAFVLEDFDPKVVLWQSQALGEALDEARAKTPSSSRSWICLDRDGDDGYEQILAAHSAEGIDDPAVPSTERALLVLYTAAFGGRPNGAQISEPGLFLQSLVHVNLYETTHDTRTLVSTPNFHITGWLDALPTFISGGTLCVLPRTDPAEILEAISRERLTNGTVQPPTARSVAELNEDGAHDISCFRSPLNVPGWTEMTSPGPGISGCGQTEVVGPVIAGGYAGEGSTPFCGRVVPIAEARVVDEAGNGVEPGDVGELIIRGPVAGLGYWNRPELNAERLSADGWWYTRDLVRRDRDGTISFVGPIAQMVKSGGENVYAAEVENALQSHEDVDRAAVIGTADPDWGQLVTAVVVTRSGKEIDEEALQEHVRTKIARYKVPRIIHFARDLPLIGGVIDYRALDEQFGGGGYPGEQQASTTNIGASTRRSKSQ
jgi:long-chain acyl-CoA synthetase